MSDEGNGTSAFDVRALPDTLPGGTETLTDRRARIVAAIDAGWLDIPGVYTGPTRDDWTIFGWRFPEWRDPEADAGDDEHPF